MHVEECVSVRVCACRVCFSESVCMSSVLSVRSVPLSLDVGEFAAYLLDDDGQVADLVLVDPEGGEVGHVGELDVGAVVVAVQDERAQPLQLPQQSRAPFEVASRTHKDTQCIIYHVAQHLSPQVAQHNTYHLR